MPTASNEVYTRVLTSSSGKSKRPRPNATSASAVGITTYTYIKYFRWVNYPLNVHLRGKYQGKYCKKLSPTVQHQLPSPPNTWAILRIQTTDGMKEIHNVVIQLLRETVRCRLLYCQTTNQRSSICHLIPGQSIDEPDGQDFETQSSEVQQHTFSHDLAATALPRPVSKDHKINKPMVLNQRHMHYNITTKLKMHTKITTTRKCAKRTMYS